MDHQVLEFRRGRLTPAGVHRFEAGLYDMIAGFDR
jgi:hypothetical protein